MGNILSSGTRSVIMEMNSQQTKIRICVCCGQDFPAGDGCKNIRCTLYIKPDVEIEDILASIDDDIRQQRYDKVRRR